MPIHHNMVKKKSAQRPATQEDKMSHIITPLEVCSCFYKSYYVLMEILHYFTR